MLLNFPCVDASSAAKHPRPRALADIQARIAAARARSPNAAPEVTLVAVTKVFPVPALVFGKWTLYREADTLWGWYTLLFSRTDVGWRIVHDHTSSAE